MAENKLADLNKAEDDAKTDDTTAADRIADGIKADPTTPLSGEGDDTPADLIATRTVDTEAKPQFEEVPAPMGTVGSEAYNDLPGSTPHVLNATPGANPAVAPNVASQRTGKVDDTVYRAPGMTRGSAINQIEVAYGELVNKLHDFDHDTTGLPDDLVALVDFIKSRSGAKA